MMKNPELIFQTISIIIAILTFIIAHIVSGIRDRKVANREIYMQLELASKDLFHFEAEHPEVMRPLWEESTPLPPMDTVEYTIVTNYACQMLNLFEMAVRFRKDKVMPPEVFGSWVIWFYDLSNAPHFPDLWGNICYNYTSDLRKIMNQGVVFASGTLGEEEKKKSFFTFVGTLLKCKHVLQWYSCVEQEIYERAGELKAGSHHDSLKS